MSRAFVAFYMGDYQKKTQHLDTLQHGAYSLLLQHCWTHGSIPIEPAARAAIARMTLPSWKKIAPIINAFFDAEGRNKRATEEIEKSERIRLQRAIAGRKGGFTSGTSKAIAKGQQDRSKDVANATRSLQQPVQQKHGICVPNKNSKLESFPTTAREKVDKTQQIGVSLATAHPMGALRETPDDGLAASLERLRIAQGRNVFVEHGTPEWNAHQHDRGIKKLNPMSGITCTVDGVEKTGLWLSSKVPDGYDEATGERIAPATAEDAA